MTMLDAMVAKLAVHATVCCSRHVAHPQLFFEILEALRELTPAVGVAVQRHVLSCRMRNGL